MVTVLCLDLVGTVQAFSRSLIDGLYTFIIDDDQDTQAKHLTELVDHDGVGLSDVSLGGVDCSCQFNCCN